MIKILDDYHCLFRLMEDLFYIGYCKTSQVINRCIYFILFLFLVGGVFLVGKKIESKEEEKQLQYEYLHIFFNENSEIKKTQNIYFCLLNILFLIISKTKLLFANVNVSL